MANAPQRSVILPSMEVLESRIGALTSTTPSDEVAALRETCKRKIRSFPLKDYLRRFEDHEAARARWELVAQFAGARPAEARGPGEEPPRRLLPCCRSPLLPVPCESAHAVG